MNEDNNATSKKNRKQKRRDEPRTETKDEIHEHLNTPGGECDWREKEHGRKEGELTKENYQEKSRGRREMKSVR